MRRRINRRNNLIRRIGSLDLARSQYIDQPGLLGLVEPRNQRLNLYINSHPRPTLESLVKYILL